MSVNFDIDTSYSKFTGNDNNTYLKIKPKKHIYAFAVICLFSATKVFLLFWSCLLSTTKAFLTFWLYVCSQPPQETVLILYWILPYISLQFIYTTINNYWTYSRTRAALLSIGGNEKLCEQKLLSHIMQDNEASQSPLVAQEIDTVLKSFVNFQIMFPKLSAM